jgi:hypothetical protein
VNLIGLPRSIGHDKSGDGFLLYFLYFLYLLRFLYLISSRQRKVRFSIQRTFFAFTRPKPRIACGCNHSGVVG